MHFNRHSFAVLLGGFFQRVTGHGRRSEERREVTETVRDAGQRASFDSVGSLDIFWLKDDSLDNLDDLPPPDVLQQEIIEHLEAALAAFRDVAVGLRVN